MIIKTHDQLQRLWILRSHLRSISQCEVETQRHISTSPIGRTPLVGTPLVPCQALPAQATTPSQSYPSTTMRTRSNKGNHNTQGERRGGNTRQRNEETNHECLQTKITKTDHTNDTTMPSSLKVVPWRSRRRGLGQRSAGHEHQSATSHAPSILACIGTKTAQTPRVYFAVAQWLGSPTPPSTTFYPCLCSRSRGTNTATELHQKVVHHSRTIPQDSEVAKASHIGDAKARSCDAKNKEHASVNMVYRSTAAPLPTTTGGQFAADSSGFLA